MDFWEAIGAEPTPLAWAEVFIALQNGTIAYMRPQLEQIDLDNKQTLIDGGMTLIEYEADFYDTILNLDSVQALHKEIDENQINGLGTKLQETLEG